MVRLASTLQRIIVALALVAAFGACQSESSPIPASGRAQRPIVGGALESGYPAVGAMTFVYPGYGYGGSFCTGTLIHQRWVLTAAHCMDEVGGINLAQNPQVIHFYVGTDAIPGPSGWPATGNLYQADAVYVHPQYNNQTQQNDIALVRLASPLTTVTPIAINVNAMNNTPTWVNQQTMYVGFGVNDGDNQSGGGIKRSGSNPINTVWQTAYESNATGGIGVCFGDSGGPGLMTITGSERVIGVNSGVTNPNPNADPCLGYGVHTRVDAFQTWINGYTGQPAPNCNSNPAVCQCPAACQANGSCNNTACQTASCEEVVTCMNACPANDDGCLVDCYYTGTTAGRAAYDALQICVSDHCANATDMGACIGQNCLTQYYGCFPPTDCAITGGDCPSGEACYPADGGHTDCYPSNGKAEGAACDASLTTSLDCADGLLCVPFTSGAYCLPFCEGNGDCDAGDYCLIPIFTNVADIGVCVCVDDDNDGYCQADDCDDNNAQTHPNATERCGDSLDNNCNGQADEGCSACVDDDGDGYCDDVDCDDANPSVNPGAAERCDDGVDNNCDGQVDESCGSCVDADEDGYCNTADCDDGDPLSSPGAVERCFDGIDNDCDGQVDEGCTSCQDIDGDGYCATVDCHDVDPNVYPGAPEICGDGLDNNCDGQVDEGCTCVDDDGDGYCLGGGPQGDCNDANAYQNPGAEEICGNGIDDNCNGVVDETCGAADRGGCAQAGGGAPGLPGVLLVLLALGLIARRRRARRGRRG